MSHTPVHVIICINTIAAYLRDQHYGCAIVSPKGGASFHQRSVFDEKAELFAQITTLEERVTLLGEALAMATDDDALADIVHDALADLGTRTRLDTGESMREFCNGVAGQIIAALRMRFAAANTYADTAVASQEGP